MIIDPLPSIYFPPILCRINQRDNSPGGGSIPFRCSWVNYTPAVTKILDTILELNRKGYTTMFCCSGHPSRPTSYTHIVMKGKIIVESVPEDFSIEEFNRGTVYRAPMLEKRLKKRKIQTLTDEEIEKLEFFVNCDLENLRKWVRQLPENKS